MITFGVPQGVLQRDFPTVRIDADLALGDDALLVLVNELDRVFDGNDVALAMAVAVIDECCQRGGLAGSSATDKDDQAAQGHRDILQHQRQTEFLESRNVQVDGAADHRDTPLLHQRIDAKAADSGRRYGEVAFLGRLKFGSLPVVHDRTREFCRVLRQQWLVGYRHHLAIDLDRRRIIGRDKEVGAVLLGHQAQQLVHEFQCLVVFHGLSPARKDDLHAHEVVFVGRLVASLDH